MLNWKQQAKTVVPKPLLERLSEFRFRRVNQRADAAFNGENAAEVFSSIYKNAIWGRMPETTFYSGGGSHEPSLVEPYVAAVTRFLSSLPSPPTVVDVGCGDFNVGSRIRSACGIYIACDVVPELIDHNRAKFADLDVDFRCIDASSDDLPDADVIFLRQVLQHLSNAQIIKVVQKLTKYRFLILTEGLPLRPRFKPNAEKRTGPGIRIASGSGIVITAPPFSLPVVAEHEICSIAIPAASVRTMVYQLH